MSAGTGASRRSCLPVRGCGKVSRQAWRNGRGTPPAPPYSASPATGNPASARCTRTWWVRPVSGRTSSERKLGERGEQTHLRGGRFPVARNAETSGHQRVRRNRPGDLSRHLARRTVHQGQILFLDRPRTPDLREGAGSITLACEDEHARRQAVETVKEQHLDPLPLPSRKLQQDPLVGGQLARGAPPWRLRREAGGLVSGDQPAVLIDDRQSGWRRRRRCQRPRPRGRHRVRPRGGAVARGRGSPCR